MRVISYSVGELVDVGAVCCVSCHPLSSPAARDSIQPVYVREFILGQPPLSSCSLSLSPPVSLSVVILSAAALLRDPSDWYKWIMGMMAETCQSTGEAC
jgi:hypothetical protein